MSNITNVNKDIGKQKIKLNVKDTDFLLKLIMKSTFEGSEIEVAHTVILKLAEMHKANLES